MEYAKRHLFRLVLVGFMVYIIGSAGASSSTGLFFHETIVFEDADSGGRSLEVDTQGNVLASFGNTLFKVNSIGEITEQRTFDVDILEIALSPDESKLAITLRSSTANSDTVHLVSTSDFTTLASSDETESNALLLKWSPNGAHLYTNAPGTGILQLNRETMDIESTFTGNHSGSMACIDVSATSGKVLTADQNGLIQLWNNDGDVLHMEIELQSEIHYCQIGENDDYFSISTPDEGIRKWAFTGSELKSININGAINYEIQDDQGILYAHKTTPQQHIVIYDVVNERPIKNVSMFHAFTDYSLMFNENNDLVDIYTNSNVNHVISYTAELQREGYGSSGIDTDGDGVPDTLDNDDDGDGIEDNWDLNCVNVGIDCGLLPDEDYIRSIDVYLNSTHLTIEQFFTLNKQHSSSIRDLNRYSLDSDIKLTNNEAQLFADSICSNMNQENLANSIASSIILENTTLVFDQFMCRVIDGMVLMPANDQTSHIRYSIELVYQFETPQDLDGAIVRLNNHRIQNDGSITELSEQHPISVSIGGENIATQEYVPWHIIEQQVSFTLGEVENEQEDLNPASFISSPVGILVILIGLGISALGGFLLLRQQSKSGEYDVSLDDEEEEEEDNEYIEDEYQSYYNDNSDEIDDDELSSEVVDNPIARPRPRPKPKPKVVSSKRVSVGKRPVSEAKRLLDESSKQVTRKRRAKKSVDSTIRTKRRKLSESQPSDQVSRKRKAVRRTKEETEEDNFQ